MECEKNGGTFESICNVIKKFAPCMNDYLYAYDIINDTYYISEKAVERFALSSNLFHMVAETHKKFVYPDDLTMLMEDLDKLVCGEKTSHNIKYRWLGKDGEPIWINCRGQIYEENGEKFLLGCINEIGEKQLADNVSNLLGEEALKEKVFEGKKNHKEGYGLRIGIDDFKDINERFGVEYGDYVLRELADCMKKVAAPAQMIYRVVGDEFMLMDTSGGMIEEAEKVYYKICREIENAIKRDNYKSVYTISGGIITNNDIKGKTYNEMTKISQFALSQAKAKGKNQVYCFKEEDYDRFLRKREILRLMRQAVARNFEGFELYFQPIMDAEHEYLMAAETLLRFHVSETEMLSPAEFIPILEDSGLIIPVGKWILKNALLMCLECQKSLPEFKISVNLSYIQISKSQILEEIIRDVDEVKLKPDSVIVELTESGYLENTVIMQTLWEKLKAYGICIALDDFGTGYSNLQNIGDLTPNIVKLDRSFTLKALKNEYENRLMAYVIQMVHSIGLKICVEGVETKDELSHIQKMKPDYIQGFYYGRPCPKGEFLEQFIKRES